MSDRFKFEEIQPSVFLGKVSENTVGKPLVEFLSETETLAGKTATLHAFEHEAWRSRIVASEIANIAETTGEQGAF